MSAFLDGLAHLALTQRDRRRLAAAPFVGLASVVKLCCKVRLVEGKQVVPVPCR